MPWKQGQSGNPGGRPKGDGEIRELAREHTPTALRTLVEICEHGQNESARVAASNALLDRGWGKPMQRLAGDAEEPRIGVEMSIEEYRRRAVAEIEEAFREYPRGEHPA